MGSSVDQRARLEKDSAIYRSERPVNSRKSDEDLFSQSQDLMLLYFFRAAGSTLNEHVRSESTVNTAAALSKVPLPIMQPSKGGDELNRKVLEVNSQRI